LAVLALWIACGSSNMTPRAGLPGAHDAVERASTLIEPSQTDHARFMRGSARHPTLMAAGVHRLACAHLEVAVRPITTSSGAGVHTTSRAPSPFAREAPSMVALRWLTTAVLVPFALFAGFSGYRAWVQVHSVTMRVPDRELRPDAVVEVDAVSWARTYVTVRLVLTQGARADTLAVYRIPSNHQASLDPRTQSAHLMIPLTAERLARFRPGEAVLRATAIGGPQWLRTPPPKVDQRRVIIPSLVTPSSAAAPRG